MTHKESKEVRLEREHIHEGKRKARRTLNKIWLWTGVIILALILLYWLFAIGTFEGPNQ